MKTRRPLARTIILVLCAAGGIAAAGTGGGYVCFEQMWNSSRQIEDLGGARCASYENCPTAIKCFAGRVSLRIARTETMSVPCQRYSGGTWDPVKRRCVGGTLQPGGSLSAPIKVEVCLDGCN